MQTTIITTYTWWNDDNEELTISSEAKSYLAEHAAEHISEMANEGYTSGQLLAELNEINYKGWWTLTITEQTND